MAYSTYEYSVKNMKKIPKNYTLHEIINYRDNIVGILKNLIRHFKQEPSKIYLCQDKMKIFAVFTDNIVCLNIKKECYIKNGVTISLKDYFFNDLENENSPKI